MRPPSFAAALVAILDLCSEPGWTATTATVEPNPNPQVARESADLALWIEVQPGPAELDPEGIRGAIATELGLATIANPDQNYAGKVSVTGLAGPAVVVRYQSRDGATKLERHVALPVDRARRSQVVSWVVGNLVRNEAAEILSGIASRRTSNEQTATANPPSVEEQTGQPDEPTPAVAAAPQTKKAAPNSKETPAPPGNQKSEGAKSKSPLGDRDLGTARVINLALVSPYVAVDRDAGEHRYALSLGGFYSRIGGLSGFGLTWLVDRVDHSANGLQLSGIWNISSTNRGASLAGVGTQASGDLSGAEISGIVALRRGCVDGAQLTGVFALAGTNCFKHDTGASRSQREAVVGAQISGVASYLEGGFRGAQLAGFASIGSGKSIGIQLSGAAGVQTGELDGSQIAGFSAIATKKLVGLQMSGAVNVATDELRGAQLGGFVNLSTKHFNGAQISGFGNIVSGELGGLQLGGGVNVAGDVHGTQISLVNVGRDVHGFQLGLVNVARENHGFSLGLFNWAKNARIQPTYFFQTPTLQNVGYRMILGHATSTVSFGYDSPKDQARTHFALGARVELGRVAFGAETGYGWVLENLSKHARDRAHELDLIGTVTVEIVPRYVSVYAGGGLAQPVSGLVAIEPRGLAQAGVSLF